MEFRVYALITLCFRNNFHRPGGYMKHFFRITGSTFLLITLFCVSAEAQTVLSAQDLYDEGIKHTKANQYDKAIEAFQAALKIDPDSAKALYGIGMALIGMNRNADAVESLKNALVLNPKSPGILINLGIAYKNLHRYDEALRSMGEAAKLDPTDTNIQNMMGSAASDAGRYEDAVGYFKRASELAPRFPAPFHNLGLTLNRMGRYADAIEPFKACLQIDPNHKSARFNLAIDYSKTGHYSEAVDSLTQYLELAPDETNGLVNRSWNYIYLGNSGKAAALDAQRYLKLYGWRTNPSAYQAIVSIIGYRSAGMDAEAKASVEQAQKRLEPGTWQYNLIRFFAGEITGDELLKIASKNDERTEAHAYIGEDLRLKGFTEEPKTHFQWVKQYGNGTFVEYTLALAELSRITN